jgi:hypothetical protein
MLVLDSMISASFGVVAEGAMMISSFGLLFTRVTKFDELFGRLPIGG